jgi:hypothetical protein
VWKCAEKGRGRDKEEATKACTVVKGMEMTDMSCPAAAALSSSPEPDFPIT